MTTYQTICAVLLLLSFFAGVPAVIFADIYSRNKKAS